MMKDLLRSIYFILLCLLGMVMGACDDIKDLLDKDKDPESVEEGIQGVWEANYYSAGETHYEIYNRITGKTMENVRHKWETKVEKDGKDGLFYLALKFDNDEVTPLSVSRLFDTGRDSTSCKFLIGYGIKYTLDNDSIIHTPLFTSRYEHTEWIITQMKRKSFTLKCIQSGKLLNGNPNAECDTFCLGDTACLQFIRLK